MAPRKTQKNAERTKNKFVAGGDPELKAMMNPLKCRSRRVFDQISISLLSVRSIPQISIIRFNTTVGVILNRIEWELKKAHGGFRTVRRKIEMKTK